MGKIKTERKTEKKTRKTEKRYFSRTDSSDRSLCSVDGMEENIRKIKKEEEDENRLYFLKQ